MFMDTTIACLPPLSGEYAPGDRTPQRLAGTGTTEAGTTKLIHNKVYRLRVGAAPVRVAFYGAAQGASAVATTSMIIPAYTEYPFLSAEGGDNSSPYGSCFVYIEAADGLAAYEAWVYRASM